MRLAGILGSGWYILGLVAVAVAVLMILDQVEAGFVLIIAFVLLGISLHIWKIRAWTPPSADDVSGQCSVCDATVDMRQGYACVNLHVERLTGGGIEVAWAHEVVSCCRSQCLRDAWSRIEPVLPASSDLDIEAAVSALNATSS